MDYFLYGIGILLFGGAVSLLIPERFKGLWIFSAAALSSVFVLIPSFNVLFSGDAAVGIFYMPQPAGEVKFVMDRLSAFFTAMISFMSAVSALYAAGYMKHYINKNRTVTSHFFFLSVLIVSMLIVTVVQNAFAFLIAWEIMSLSSFFLLIFENEKEEVFKAGVNYLVSMHIGVIFLITAFIIMINRSGSMDFSSFTEVFNSEPGLINTMFLLFFAGFGTKAGFVPFHTWLPRAHPAAPSHISGLMSGIMIKTGIYGILRIITIIPQPTSMMAYLVLFISLISGILGIAYAIAQGNIKKLLAYSSVENIGIIGLGIGAGLLGITNKMPALAFFGFTGSLLHILNHSVFKPMLFFAAGGVLHAAHTLEIDKLGGLIKKIRWTAVFFLVGSIAISGLPPFNGFISEFIIYRGFLSGMQTSAIPAAVSLILSFAGLALIGAMALLCFTKVFSIVFLGSPRTELSHPLHDITFTMKAALVLQSAIVILTGLVPAPVFSLISLAGAELAGQRMLSEHTAETSDILSRLSGGLLIFLGIFAVVFIVRSFLLRGRVTHFKTWDCGYQAGNTRMQYTASSYTGPFLNLIRPLLYVKEQLSKPSGIFPLDAAYKSGTEDKFEMASINPVIRFIDRFLNLFTWIQSGNMQQYILYGIVFLIAISVWITGI
ncbi:MAG: hypothetical protein JW864_16310 [Spirochaetes bacterium]|nr:hypothetical protein [Spirochaetota bacterium]